MADADRRSNKVLTHISTCHSVFQLQQENQHNRVSSQSNIEPTRTSRYRILPEKGRCPPSLDERCTWRMCRSPNSTSSSAFRFKCLSQPPLGFTQNISMLYPRIALWRCACLAIFPSRTTTLSTLRQTGHVLYALTVHV